MFTFEQALPHECVGRCCTTVPSRRLLTLTVTQRQPHGVTQASATSLAEEQPLPLRTVPAEEIDKDSLALFPHCSLICSVLDRSLRSWQFILHKTIRNRQLRGLNAIDWATLHTSNFRFCATMHGGYKTSRAMIARPSLAMVLVMVTSLLDVLPVIPRRKEAAFAPSGPLTGGTLHCCTAMRLQLVGVCSVVIVILLFAAIVAVGFSTLARRPKFADNDPIAR